MIKHTKYQIQNTKYKAFLLIEALTLIFIFALISVTFYSVFTVGIRYIQDAKNRLGALAVANARLEIIRNLAYDSIGTVGGTISGNIPQDQDISENTRPYHVHTEVVYIDDPFDGIAYADTVWFEDYKKVTITISWSSGSGTESVELVSRFVPPGKEVPHIGDGILSVNIFSDQPGGGGVVGSQVHIYNPETTIDTSLSTDDSGNATFMGSSVSDSIQKYQITVTKAGYETVTTMPPYPDSAYNPVDIHASVVTGTGSVNLKNIVQNQLANIRISIVDYLNAPIADANFHLSGGRKLGTDIVEPYTPVYNLNEDGVTDSDGKKSFNSVSPGEYNFSLIDSTFDDYEVINITPIAPFSLLSADGTLDVTVKLVNKTTTALLIGVVADSDDAPIVGAKVRLTNTSLGYDVELETTDNGKVFFPNSTDPFLPETYHMKITASGFSDNESDVVITAGNLKKDEIRL
ncbi:MAG: carboxypeptidase-like regulatory domain-containing protein [Candidatus Moraniibacteriota bacterium]